MGLRINGGVGGLARNLGATNEALRQVLLQLSTGLRINSAADGPAALVISEGLRANIAGQTALIENTTRAAQLVQVADAGLTEVSRQLNNLRGLAIEAANTGVNSPEATAALQQQIDAGLAAIGNIAGTTTFGSLSLLNGNLDNAQFQITENSPVTLTVPDLDPSSLGTGVQNASSFTSLASIDVSTAQGATDALAIIDAAQAEVNAVRANLGAFQSNVLESNVRSLQTARQNLIMSESSLRGVNVAEVTARVSLLRALLEAGVNIQSLAEEQRAGLFLNLLG